MFFDLIAWDASAVPFEGPLLRVLSRSCWNINWSFVRHGLGLPLVLKAKPIYSSKHARSPRFLLRVDLDSEGSVLTSWRRPDAHAGMKIILIPSLNNALLHNLPGNVFGSGKRDFFLAFDTFSADSSCQLLSCTHKKTQVTMIEHLHKLANTGIWRLISCQPGDWSQKEPPWQQIMQQLSYRKVEFTTEKENYSW